ncbi:MAG TPA: metal ABC transporter permease [Verrucomicrobiota bacterium]|nr:metal ABC transporter permease [Verrucomicrobiota bacterium]HNT15255.1 metal ABC transporter permease [Verrucomicrobiota bacterium]
MNATDTLTWVEMFTVMKWPLLACLLLPGILVYYGLHILRREVIFVDLALAQVATLGTCVCLFLGHEPDDPHNYFWALGFTLAGALLFTFTRPSRQPRVPQEALIGIIYVVAAAAGILLLSKSPHGKEELQRTLVGDLLTVTPGQIAKTAALYAAIGVIHFIFRRQFIKLSFEHEAAAHSSWSMLCWDFLFYALFGFVVTSFVQVGGVLMVFSYLIVPAACATFLVNSLLARLLVGWGVATLASVGGLYASFTLDVPTGAAIVCMLGAALALVAGGVKCLRRVG